MTTLGDILHGDPGERIVAAERLIWAHVRRFCRRRTAAAWASLLIEPEDVVQDVCLLLLRDLRRGSDINTIPAFRVAIRYAISDACRYRRHAGLMFGGSAARRLPQARLRRIGTQHVDRLADRDEARFVLLLCRNRSERVFCVGLTRGLSATKAARRVSRSQAWATKTVIAIRNRYLRRGPGSPTGRSSLGLTREKEAGGQVVFDLYPKRKLV